MTHLRDRSKAKKRIGQNVDRIVRTIGHRSSAQCGANEFEGKLNVLGTSGDTAQHGAASNVGVESPPSIAKWVGGH
jgi:hypothetical protein